MAPSSITPRSPLLTPFTYNVVREPNKQQPVEKRIKTVILHLSSPVPRLLLESCTSDFSTSFSQRWYTASDKLADLIALAERLFKRNMLPISRYEACAFVAFVLGNDGAENSQFASVLSFGRVRKKASHVYEISARFFRWLSQILCQCSDDTVSVYVGNPLSETDIFCVWRQRQLR